MRVERETEDMGMDAEGPKRTDRLSRLLCVLGIAIFGFLALFSCFSTKRMYTGSESLYWEWDNVLWKLAAAAVLALFCGLICRMEALLTQKGIHIAAVLASLAAVLFCVLLTNAGRSEPEADQWYVYVATEGLFSGDYTTLQEYVYYTVCPYQLGLAQLYAGIARMAGGTLSYEVLRYAQAVCVGLGVYFLWGISRELFRKMLAQCLCIGFSLAFLPMMLYSQFLYGETIGVCMALASIYFFLLGNRPEGPGGWRRGLWLTLSAAAFALVYLVRPALIVVWVAMALIQLCLCRRQHSLLPMLFILLMLLAGIGTQKLVVGSAGRTAGVDVDNGMPVVPLTIAMGMQDNDPNRTGTGSYNAYNYNLFAETGQDQKEASRLAWRNIGGNLYRWAKDPARMCRHLFHKTLNQWTEPAYDAFTMTYKMAEPRAWVENLYYDGLHSLAYGWLDCFQTFCYVLLALWFLHLLRAGGSMGAQDYLIGLIMIGEFFFSILWEASCRYVYPYMVIVIPCAAGSLGFYFASCRNRLRAHALSGVKGGDA